VSAIDAATGRVVWRAPSTPSYAAATYSNGVVFAPSTTSFSAAAYDADTGLPLWTFPLGAAAASGTAIDGSSIFLGSGLSQGQAGPTTVPPGNNGVWSFTVRAGAPGLAGVPEP
jgi:outer membrane protein assembly factor BamB